MFIKLIVPLDIHKEAFEARVLRDLGVGLHYYGVDEVRRKPLICHEYGIRDCDAKHFYAIHDIARAMQLEFISKLI